VTHNMVVRRMLLTILKKSWMEPIFTIKTQSVVKMVDMYNRDV
jgi:hypothetical protein